jgi:hypothetical protein
MRAAIFAPVRIALCSRISISLYLRPRLTKKMTVAKAALTTGCPSEEDEGADACPRHGDIQEGRMQFKTLILATTSLVALAVPASAGGMMGDVSLGYSHSWEDFEFGGEFAGDFDFNQSGLTGQARVNLPYSDTVNIQLDAVGHGLTDDFGDEHFVVGGHINYRDKEGLLGIFVGTGSVTDFGSPTSVYMAGIEGQFFCNQWTLGGQLGYLDSDAGPLLQNAGFVRGSAAFYASKQLRLTGSVAYINGEAFSSADVEEWAWTAGVSYWFGKSIPVSGFVEYRGRTAELESFAERDDHSLNLGVTFHFGGDGFQDADRNGASAVLADPDWYRIPSPIF